MDYISLFISAFAAATILPFASEVLLLALLEQGRSPALLWLVATSGNTGGALVNWLLGRELLRFQHRRWFYFSPEQIARAQSWFNRIGKWSLLFAWLPIIGDGLTLAAGIMKVPARFFILAVGLGKGLRYGVVIYLWQLS